VCTDNKGRKKMILCLPGPHVPWALGHRKEIAGSRLNPEEGARKAGWEREAMAGDKLLANAWLSFQNQLRRPMNGPFISKLGGGGHKRGFQVMRASEPAERFSSLPLQRNPSNLREVLGRLLFSSHLPRTLIWEALPQPQETS
jgi:hypothetical protein